jgi:uncharacterized membrane protein
MLKNILSYLIILVVFLVFDVAWIGVVARKFYAKSIGFLMAKKPNWTPAICFYLLYVLGIMFFVVNPAIEKESIAFAVLSGGFFGLIAYSTYDLTNLATIKDWPIKLTVIDLIWGGVLTSITSMISFTFISLFL